MSEPVCVIVGVGPGNGLAFAKKFAGEGYRVAMLARSGDALSQFEKSVAGAHGYVADVMDEASLSAALGRVRDDLGPADVLIYNAGAGGWNAPEKTTPEEMEASWRTNALGCLLASQSVIPDMKERGSGAIVVIGAGAALRGRATTTAFAAAKAAQRSLAQSLARRLGPAGIHVAYVVIDGVIDLPRTRAALPDKGDDFFLNPAHIADTVHGLVAQPRSAWTFELDLRPFGENW